MVFHRLLLVLRLFMVAAVAVATQRQLAQRVEQVAAVQAQVLLAHLIQVVAAAAYKMFLRLLAVLVVKV
jgi:hypothetical protein